MLNQWKTSVKTNKNYLTVETRFSCMINVWDALITIDASWYVILTLWCYVNISFRKYVHRIKLLVNIQDTDCSVMPVRNVHLIVLTDFISIISGWIVRPVHTCIVLLGIRIVWSRKLVNFHETLSWCRTHFGDLIRPSRKSYRRFTLA